MSERDIRVSIMAEAGFFSIELDQIQLALSTPLTGEFNLRVDVEIINGPDDLRWVTSGTTMVQSEKMVPFYQAPVEADPAALAEGGVEGYGSVVVSAGDDSTLIHKYIVGFAGKSGMNNFNLRSTYLTLSGEAVTKFTNATLSVKCVVVREAPPPPVETKKGAPPPVQAPTDEVITDITFPLSVLVRAKGSVLADAALPLDTAAVAAGRPDWQLTATHPHPHMLGTHSSISWRVAADNDLAEYLMGCSLVAWQGAVLPAPPAVWAFHCADVVDPKAKVQPTEADQRKKWIENIEKMVAVQGKYATFSAEIVPRVGVEGEGGLESVGSVGSGGAGAEGGVADGTLPPISLAPGVIVFDGGKAVAAGEENLRLRTDLWTVSWGPSPLIFLHRTTVRRLLSQGGSGGGGRYSLVMRKTPVGEGVAGEDGARLEGGVDITPLLGMDGRWVGWYRVSTSVCWCGVVGCCLLCDLLVWCCRVLFVM